MAKKQEKSRWPFIILVVALLTFAAFIFSGIITIFVIDDYDDPDANVAIIPIKGTIVADASSDFFSDSFTSSTDTLKLIRKAQSNPNIKAIIFEINSGGGSPVASEEIANAIKKTNKTTVAWIRETGASGAYWIASAADKIIASRLSITGSIGVIGSYLEFSGFLERYNVTYQRLVSGKYKDAGTPFKELSLSEKRLYQQILDKTHKIFIEDVANNRRLTSQQVAEVSNAFVYLGDEAKEIGLIDEIGDYDTVISIIEERIGEEAHTAYYEKKKTLFDILGEVAGYQSFFIGKGIGSELFDIRKQSGFDVIA